MVSFNLVPRAPDLGLFPFKLRIAHPNFNGKSPGWLFSEVRSSPHGGPAFLRVFLLVLIYVCVLRAFSRLFLFTPVPLPLQSRCVSGGFIMSVLSC